ncbi:alpha-L-fucosidase [Paenarthrobacter sp. PH39-S1]|uniref:alpha-L-fucosidase n=1 Tax=Paenarthrobacter sp. PH39-S1 TaxID=3046204 RepID=UPI0024B951A2|nr:alpha-L-fucosidase [Paenarthrobacter sp. PH39-S1]MDJ0358164.1 alpha-L-fucosidase [Paenarthrobacter sp. PH39-S1]
MINFEDRVGPDFGANAPNYPEWEFPQWLEDAKFGIFVHWGLYSVPAWAETGHASMPVEDAYRDHQYAEWYGNTVRLDGSSAQKYQRSTFGAGSSYEDLADVWKAESFDAAGCIDLFRRAGAKYVVPTTKHHDGFCLWNTDTTPFNSAVRGPKRDLVEEFATASRGAGLRFGCYFSGALDWHVSDFPAINSDPDIFRLRRKDEHFARYSYGQVHELVERFAPDILWNDIEWPDAGKSNAEFGLAALFDEYRAAVPDGIVNDRWGVPSHGYLTREYSDIGGLSGQHWESCRGLGRSFGFNQQETDADVLSVPELVHHLVSVVSRNGNFLLNIGLAADGTVPERYRQRLLGLGQWLSINGEAIYGTRPWQGTMAPEQQAHYAVTVGAGASYLSVLTPGAELPSAPLDTSGGVWLGAAENGTGGVRVPAALAAEPVAVLRIPHPASGETPA